VPSRPDDDSVKRFLVLFGGSEGTTFFCDVLGRTGSVLVPAFEPLERHQPYMKDVALERRLEWFYHVFNMPAQVADRDAWSAKLKAVIPEMAIDLKLDTVRSALAVGFKMRPGALVSDRETSSRRLRLPRRRRGEWSAAPRMLDAICDAGVSLVVFRRHDVVRRAVSSYRMTHQQKSQFRSVLRVIYNETVHPVAVVTAFFDSIAKAS